MIFFSKKIIKIIHVLVLDMSTKIYTASVCTAFAGVVDIKMCTYFLSESEAVKGVAEKLLLLNLLLHDEFKDSILKKIEENPTFEFLVEICELYSSDEAEYGREWNFHIQL